LPAGKGSRHRPSLDGAGRSVARGPPTRRWQRPSQPRRSSRVDVPSPPRIGMIDVQVDQLVVRAGSDVDAEPFVHLIRGMLP